MTQERYQRAWDRIIPGLRITIETTIYAFVIALAIGLVAGLGRISRNVVTRNLATFYIEFVRGVPILVLIFTIAYTVVPDRVGRARLRQQQRVVPVARASWRSR